MSAGVPPATYAAKRGSSAAGPKPGRGRFSVKLGGGYWRRLSELRAPHRENLDALRGPVYTVIDVMLCTDEHDAPHACKFDIFSDGSGFGIFGDECERPSEFLAKEVRSLCAIASPPMRLVANLLRGDRRRLYAKRH